MTNIINANKILISLVLSLGMVFGITTVATATEWDNYDSTDYGSYDYGSTDYGSYDYDYDSTDYGAYDYGSTDYGAYDYSSTDYDYGSVDYGSTDYGSYDYDSTDYGYAASFVPSYASAYSNANASARASSSGSGGSFNFSPRISYSPKTSNKYVYNSPSYVRPTYPTQPVQPIIINPAPAPVASQPINIVNNNVNNNVNTNTNTVPTYVAPVAVQPIIMPVPTTTTPQCAIYATASTYKGARVTLSWATELGDTTDVYCSGGALSNRRVSAISTASIYPYQSTTCYATVRKVSTGASKTCQVYIPVENTIQPYIPQYTPAPYIPHQYNYGSITLANVPYTGAEDYIYPMFLLAIVLTAGYVLYSFILQRRRNLA